MSKKRSKHVPKAKSSERPPRTALTSYLHQCRDAFHNVTRVKYGTPFDLPAIERSVAHLRGNVVLRYEDLRAFEAKEHWWFTEFWIFPPDHHVTPALKRRPFNFWKLPTDEAATIGGLLAVFKSIELVSIVLRFIRPDAYGILSPPVERVLDVRRGSDAVETYLNYTNDLRRLKKHYGFERAADADMALWVLHEYCFGTLRDANMHAAYLADPFMTGMRVKNRMADLLEGPPRVEVIRALVPIDADLAGQLAGIGFERLVRAKAREAGLLDSEDLELAAVIDAIRDKRVIDVLTCGRWHAARRTRNRAVHGLRPLTEPELRRLIAELG